MLLLPRAAARVVHCGCSSRHLCLSGRRQRGWFWRVRRRWVRAPAAAAPWRPPSGGEPRRHLQHVLWGRDAGGPVSAAAAAATAAATAAAAGGSQPVSPAHAAHAHFVAVHDVVLQRLSCQQPNRGAVLPARPGDVPRAHDHPRQRARDSRRDQVLGAGRLPQKVRPRPAVRGDQRAANLPRHPALGVRAPAQQPKAHDLQGEKPAAKSRPRQLARRSRTFGHFGVRRVPAVVQLNELDLQHSRNRAALGFARVRLFSCMLLYSSSSENSTIRFSF